LELLIFLKSKHKLKPFVFPSLKGNLPPDARTKDLEDLFEKYGKINYVDLKNRKGPPFAFIEFEDPRDAEDAVDGRDGYNYDGYKLRVEFQKGSKSTNPDNSDKSQISKGSSSRSGPPSRRSEYRCIITGLI
jgi:arginine/serine-rich splicing factor 1/9